MASWFHDPWLLGVGTALAAAAIIALSKWGRAALSRPWQRIRTRSGSVPTKTIMVVLPQPNGLWWHMGSRLGKEAMQVVADLYASNLTGDPLHLSETYIARPRTQGNVLVRHPSRDIFGQYPIVPRGTSELSCVYWIVPPVRKKEKRLMAPLIFLDQDSNKHVLRRMRFDYR